MTKFNGTADQIESTENKVNEIEVSEAGEKQYPTVNAVASYVGGYAVPIKYNGEPVEMIYAQKGYGAEDVVTIMTDLSRDNDSVEMSPSDNAKCIPIRNSRGNLYSGTPTEPMEAANKKYVDDSITNIDVSNKLDKMTDEASNIASGKMYPKFYAVDKVDEVVQDTLLKGSFDADGNTIAIRNSNGQLLGHNFEFDDDGNRIAEHKGVLVNKPFLESRLAKEKENIDKSLKNYVPIQENWAPVPVIYAQNSGEADNFTTIMTDLFRTNTDIENYPSDNANYIPIRNASGNLYTGTPTETMEAANKKYVDELLEETIPTESEILALAGNFFSSNFIPRKLTHAWIAANGTVPITRSTMYFCCCSGSGDVQVVDESGTAVTDGEGDSISAAKVFILLVPENTTSYNSVKGYMCFYVGLKEGGSILSSIDGGAGNIFVPTADMEAGNRFIKTAGGMNVWTMPFDL